MKSVLVILSVVVVFSAVALAQTQRDQVMAAQHYQQQQTAQPQQQQQSHHHGHGDLKSSGSKVTRREYPYDNSYWVIGLCLIPLLILLCFPLFSTPYYGGHHGGHHHGGWGWGRSAKDTEAIQERVLKSVEGN